MVRFLILLYVLTPQIVFSQGDKLLLHFNNANDRALMENSILNLVNIEDFKKVAIQTSNSDTQIQILFFDPKYVGILETEQQHTITPELYLKKWYELYDGSKKRIVFFFTKEGIDYKFNSLSTTDILAEGQLPEIVRNFIEQQILKTKGTYREVIKSGFHALKNAFDQRFLDNLVEYAHTLFPDNQCYKGYSCIDYDYFFIERVENSSIQSSGCDFLFLREDDINYKEVYPYAPPNIESPTSLQSTVMDFYASKYLIYKKMNLVTGESQDVPLKTEDESKLAYQGQESGKFKLVTELNYVYDYFDFSMPSTTYTGINDAKMPSALKKKIDQIYSNPYQFKEWKYNNAANSPLIFEQNVKACVNTHRVRIFNGRIKARIDQVDERHGISTWGSSDFRKAQPTWCNVFARTLSRKVFGKDAFPPKSCKGLYDEEFTVKSGEYVEITVKDPDFIWGLINKGYPVYFISTSHIETGFPDDFAHTSYRYRYEGDSRYNPGNYTVKEDNNVLIEVPDQDKNIVVGAGATVGFKQNWLSYEWLRSSAKIYLYLGYLKNEYE
jgi:hypothetical protein